jgi:superfamily II DNA or RNA helicase
MNFVCVSERDEVLKMADNSLVIFSIFTGIGKTFIGMEEVVRVKDFSFGFMFNA